MAVYRMDKFPPDHPFAGVRVIFDAAMRKRVQELRDRRDPMQGAVDIIEEAYRTREPVANDDEEGAP